VEQTKVRDLYEDKADMQSASLYSLLMLADGSERRATSEELSAKSVFPKVRDCFDRTL